MGTIILFMAPAAAEIDEDRESRQLLVYGKEAMGRMAASKVLIIGMNGLGAEIAKNVILANMKAVTIADDKTATVEDLGSNFYLTEAHVGKNRASNVATFQELNPYCDIKAHEGRWTDALVRDPTVVVVVDATLADATHINEVCRSASPPIAFIRADARGLSGSCFCDFGPGFKCLDTTGEAIKTGIVESIEMTDGGKRARVEFVKDPTEQIDFDDGETVVFSEVKGMEALNGKQVEIQDVSKGRKSMSIPCTEGLGAYVSGGIVTQVKMPKDLAFRSLSECQTNPGEMIDCDSSKQSKEVEQFTEKVMTHFGQPTFAQKFGNSGLLHLGHRALDAFAAKNGGVLPSTADLEAVLAIATEMNDALPEDNKVEGLDDRKGTIAALVHGCRSVLNPICAIFGGLVGQQVVKAVSGKFHPTFQCFYFDAFECYGEPGAMPSDTEAKGTRYDAQVAVF